VLGGLALAACRTAAPPRSARAAPAPDVQYLVADPSSGRPFSDAVRVGRMLYLSGQIGTDAQGRLVPGGIVAETRQALDNIRAVLERNGSSMARVVKCTVMLADIGEWGTMNSVYVTYFPTHKPARSALGASGLALGARVEIECWATLPEG
jgi:reactive intermediate/imine deaminase